MPGGHRRPHPALTGPRKQGLARPGRIPSPVAALLASIPSPGQRRARARPDLDPRVRADAPARDRRVHLAHGRPLDAARRRLGPRLPRRRLGRRRRHRRRARSTTCSRAGTRCPTSGGASSRSGRAASASGAGSGSGSIVGAIVVRRSGASVFAFMDAVAPGLLLAQAIGRWGNWWNQELFGEPTDLPWGLEIDPENRPAEFAADETFHPTFLYEFVWNLARRRRAARRRAALAGSGRPGLFALYVAFYCFGRFFEELLRDRPRARARPAAPERLGRRSSCSCSRSRSSSGGRSSARAGSRRDAGAEAAADDGHPARPRPRPALASRAMVVRELELDLDAFEGPFDLLLTLVLQGGARAWRRSTSPGSCSPSSSASPSATELDLDACGEFLVLVVGAARAEGARAVRGRGGRARRARARGGGGGAGAPARRVPADEGRGRAGSPSGSRRERDRFFRLGPAPLAPRPRAPRSRRRIRRRSAAALRVLAAEPPPVSLAHMALRFPPVGRFLERFRAVLRRRHALRLRQGGRGPLARRAGGRVPRPARAAEGRRDRARPGRALRADPGLARRQESTATEEKRPAWTVRSA